MKPLAECLGLIQGRSIEEFTREHPHPVLIGLGVIAGEMQRNPAKAAGTMFLSLSGVPEGGEQGPLVNQVFNVEKVSSGTPADGVYMGSGDENDICLVDTAISRIHTHLVQRPEGLHVVDHGSTNGTFINGSRLEPGVPTIIRSGDILTVGRFSFTYYDPVSFAKLLTVQAMARERSRSTVRTPGAARSLGPRATPPPPPGRPGPASPPPWGAGGPNSALNIGPAPTRPPEGAPWQSVANASTGEWQQRAIGRTPQSPAYPVAGQPVGPFAGQPSGQPAGQSGNWQAQQPSQAQLSPQQPSWPPQPGPAPWTPSQPSQQPWGQAGQAQAWSSGAYTQPADPAQHGRQPVPQQPSTPPAQPPTQAVVPAGASRLSSLWASVVAFFRRIFRRG